MDNNATTPAPVTVQVTLEPQRLPESVRGHFQARATLDNETAAQRLARLLSKTLGGNESPFTVRPA